MSTDMELKSKNEAEAEPNVYDLVLDIQAILVDSITGDREAAKEALEKAGALILADRIKIIKSSNLALLERVEEELSEVEAANDSNGRYNACVELRQKLTSLRKEYNQ